MLQTRLPPKASLTTSSALHALLPHTFLHTPKRLCRFSRQSLFPFNQKQHAETERRAVFLVLWLSVPLVAQGVDLVGKLCQVLVGTALVVLDDSQQTLAGIEQALEEEYEAQELEQIYRLLEKRGYVAENADEREFRRTYQFLMRRGFKSNEILTAMKRR